MCRPYFGFIDSLPVVREFEVVEKIKIVDDLVVRPVNNDVPRKDERTLIIDLWGGTDLP